MIATVLSDIALNIGALAAVIGAVGVLKAVARAKRIEAKMGAAIVTIDGIDRMVNQQPKHAPSIPKRLEDIAAQLERTNTDVLDLHSKVDDVTAITLANTDRLDSIESQLPPNTP